MLVRPLTKVTTVQNNITYGASVCVWLAFHWLPKRQKKMIDYTFGQTAMNRLWNRKCVFKCLCLYVFGQFTLGLTAAAAAAVSD